MRKFISLILLSLVAAQAIALPHPAVTAVPEPEVLSLLAIGGAALLMVRRKK